MATKKRVNPLQAIIDFKRGEGHAPSEPVTLDDVVHALALGGAAPEAKARKPRQDDGE